MSLSTTLYIIWWMLGSITIGSAFYTMRGTALILGATQLAMAIVILVYNFGDKDE